MSKTKKPNNEIDMILLEPRWFPAEGVYRPQAVAVVDNLVVIRHTDASYSAFVVQNTIDPKFPSRAWLSRIAGFENALRLLDGTGFAEAGQILNFRKVYDNYRAAMNAKHTVLAFKNQIDRLGVALSASQKKRIEKTISNAKRGEPQLSDGLYRSLRKMENGVVARNPAIVCAGDTLMIRHETGQFSIFRVKEMPQLPDRAYWTTRFMSKRALNGLVSLGVVNKAFAEKQSDLYEKFSKMRVNADSAKDVLDEYRDIEKLGLKLTVGQRKQLEKIVTDFGGEI